LEPAKRILVTPDQVSQRDPRPWRRGTFAQLVAGYLLLSAIVVGVGVLILAFLGFWTLLARMFRPL